MGRTSVCDDLGFFSKDARGPFLGMTFTEGLPGVVHPLPAPWVFSSKHANKSTQKEGKSFPPGSQ